MHHPRLSRVYLCAAAAFLVICSAYALRRLRSGVRFTVGESGVESLVHGAPIAAFALLNGLAFALTQDLVHIRYALFAHVAILTLVYALAFSGRAPADAQSST
jgi:hypothetical protein